ncbi:hypothetical protein FQN52_007012 [Onygenales sp. PD_12]|nr:hypothetical protein FQN52_007012 [Onygenales sp. PD_12]
MPSAVLKCSICPKKPNFSDVSHLLTHVSSKGHLSHYFKLQVKSHQEPAAGQLLAAYDQWYNEHNLAGLLSDRMLTKEAKKGTSTVDNGPSTKRSSKSSRSSNPAPRPAKQPANELPSYLDPRMTLPYVSHPQDQPPTGSVGSVSNRAPGPRAQLWPTHQLRAPLTDTKSTTLNTWNANAESSGSEDVSPIVQRKRGLVDQSENTTPYSLRRPRRPVTPDPFVDNDSSAYADEYEDDPETKEDGARLKGILWPGMDIFDSATEQMRKKRNQKKDGSVLKQMEKTSENVEATELVFSPGGTLRKERHISGNVEDWSPLKGETPIPKPKRVTRARRPPLSQSSSNLFNLRGQSRKLVKTEHRRHTSSLEELSRQTLPLLETSPAHRSLHYFGNDYAPADEDFKMTYSDLDQKPRRGFSIYNDNKEGIQSALRDALAHEEEVAERMASAGAETKPYYGTFAGSKQLLHSQQTSSYPFPAGKPYPNNRATNLPEYRVGKENIEPLMDSDGRVDSHAGQGNWSGHTDVDDGRYASQYYYPGPHNGFGGFGESDTFGYSCNPLSYSYSHQQVNAATPRSSDTRPPHEKPQSGHAPSPDGTTSDLDRDEFGRLYLDGLTK